MAQSDRTVNLAGATVGCQCHVCALLESRDDEYKILVPFIKEGLEANDRIVQVIDESHRSECLRRLAESGIAVAAAERYGRLEVRPWESAHLQGGRFDQHAVIALLEEMLTTSREQGFAVTRLWGNMEWALEQHPGTDDIIEYEARLNHILPTYDTVAVCTYDVTKFSAAVLMEIVRAHPKVISNGILRENPSYVPPDQFLRELSDRDTAHR